MRRKEGVEKLRGWKLLRRLGVEKSERKVVPICMGYLPIKPQGQRCARCHLALLQGQSGVLSVSQNSGGKPAPGARRKKGVRKILEARLPFEQIQILW